MGERIGNFEVVRRLAQGGMAEVLLAKQRGMGGFERLVCLKRILPHLRRRDDFLKMFQDEARIAANLIHPNIAQIYAISQDGDDFFIAMEYVRGEDLRRVYNQEAARGEAIPQPIAAQVAMGAAAGLDYAHRQTNLNGRPLGIVHRDISPQNIVVTFDGHAKLIDFGVAKAANKLIETRSGVLKGKYSYMSPEQASGRPVDARTDIFALGITLYEVTLGTRLFKRDTELETIQAVIACEVPLPSSILPTYDRELERVVMRALAADPTERFVTAGEMEQALDNYLHSRGLSASATQLAAYMQDLFAEKLTDEALFGGPPWNEPDTSQRPPAHRQPAETVALGAQAHQETIAQSAPATERVAAPPDDASESKAPSRGDAPEPSDAAAGAAEAQKAADKGWDLEISGEGPTRILKPESTPHDHDQGPQSGLDPSAGEDEPVGVAEAPAALLAPGPAASPATATATQAVRRNTPLWRRPGALVGAVLIVAAATAGGWALVRTRDTTATEAPAAQSEAGSPNEPPLDPSHAWLTITAPIPLEVTLGSRYLGDTPLRRLAIEPGSYRLRLQSRLEGVVLRRNVHLQAGNITHVHVSDQRGNLRVWGRPWAWVQVGLQAPRETPLQLDLIEGEYTLTFECPDGRRHWAVVEVVAGGTQATGVDCERAGGG